MVLASASPRRRELLARVFPIFEVLAADVDEDALTTDDPVETAELLAREKALAVLALRPETMVVAGDTVVAIQEPEGWVQLAKPADEADAQRMLRLLSGRTHLVVTGVCVATAESTRLFHESSWVTFRDLSDLEISAYVATKQPMDKAGAYGLQDMSGDFIPTIEGLRTNVIGLPVERLARELNVPLRDA